MTEQEKMPSVVYWGAVTNDPKAPSWFQGGAQYIRRDIVDGLVGALRDAESLIEDVQANCDLDPVTSTSVLMTYKRVTTALTTYQGALK